MPNGAIFILEYPVIAIMQPGYFNWALGLNGCEKSTHALTHLVLLLIAIHAFVRKRAQSSSAGDVRAAPYCIKNQDLGDRIMQSGASSTVSQSALIVTR